VNGRLLKTFARSPGGDTLHLKLRPDGANEKALLEEAQQQERQHADDQ
jgi:hypothetical protein